MDNRGEKMRSRILEEVNNFRDENGFSPTVREIGRLVGLSSSSTVYYHLAVLEELGKIQKSPNTARSITVKNNIRG